MKRDRKKQEAAVKTPTKDSNLKARRSAALRSMAVNRYLLVRYSLAVLLLFNVLGAFLCWPELSGWVFGGLSLIGGLGAIEVGLQVTSPERTCKILPVFFAGQALVSITLLAALLNMPCSSLLPCFNDGADAANFALVLNAAGFVLSAVCLIRLYKISRNQDKQMQKIVYFKQKYNLYP